ncbi:MAG: vWA domain-containing protein [Gammaproteobacteria bacterium]|nr:vWA domain-containing protein [Gammaproteobacteria bacterium]
MARYRPRSRRGLVFAALAVVIAVAIVLIQQGDGWLQGFSELTREEAETKLSRVLGEVSWREAYVTSRARVELGGKASLSESLPPIAKFPMTVNPSMRAGDVAVEIFASTEKSGSGTDGWMVEVANAFNARNVRLSSGRTAKVKVRKIASGTGHEFIASGKYRPQGFSPSNHLWVRMTEAQGVAMTPVSESMVGNIAGLVMKEEVAERLRAQYGEVNVRNLIDAVVQGNLVMGYTNPFASSTGLNFLVTVLARFADGDEARMLSPEVVSGFEGFQRGVPFVALTTLQMRDSVEKDGSLDAFVMEYQTFVKTQALASGYEFIPFGIRHDNPLYGVGELGEDEREALEKFAAFAAGNEYTALAKSYGFNPPMEYASPFPAPSGKTLVAAQRLWKEKKDAGRPIIAVFLCDVSGSMRGARMRGVKQALLDGAEFISEGNSIGMVVFSNDVRVVLPIRAFDLNHKAAFHAAVQALDAGGGTAMYDGVAVALSMLAEESRRNPDAKPLLFVLTDGKTNEGLAFADMQRIIKGMRIPVYTIGYEADLDELGRLSSLVEAASLNADEGEIRYRIGSLLNAQM